MFMNLYQCDWVGPAQGNTATCSVPASDVLVGGGAEIENNAHPGALLKGSYPDQAGALTTWVASSHDAQTAYPHRLRAYAIGLQLVGMTATSLRNSMFQSFATSAVAAHPAAASAVASTRVLVGGGARVVSGNQYLVYSSPVAGLGGNWTAGSKDHISSSPGTVRAYAIGVLRCPPGYVGGCLTSGSGFTSGNSPSGYSAFMFGPSGSFSALTSIGGRAVYSGSGRMLTDMYPFLQTTSPFFGSLVRSKDHVVASTGSTYAIGLMLKRE
jgi:hypothetical protein